MYSLTLSTVFNGLSFMHSIHYCIINNIIHQCIINNHRETSTNTQYTRIYVETQMGENHGMIFLYVRRNTFIGSTNFPIFQLQLEGGSNPLILRLQPEGSYNSLNSLAPTRRRLQPPDSQAPT
jgi:hypothetical protein